MSLKALRQSSWHTFNGLSSWIYLMVNIAFLMKSLAFSAVVLFHELDVTSPTLWEKHPGDFGGVVGERKGEQSTGVCSQRPKWVWTRTGTGPESVCETPAKDIWKGRKKLIAFVNELLNATSDATASCLRYWLLLIRFVRCTRWQQSI